MIIINMLLLLLTRFGALMVNQIILLKNKDNYFYFEIQLAYHKKILEMDLHAHKWFKKCFWWNIRVVFAF